MKITKTIKEAYQDNLQNGKILANNWKQIFAGIVVVDIVYIDNNLVIFDIDLLARLKGIRLCIRKEPDYF